MDNENEYMYGYDKTLIKTKFKTDISNFIKDYIECYSETFEEKRFLYRNCMGQKKYIYNEYTNSKIFRKDMTTRILLPNNNEAIYEMIRMLLGYESFKVEISQEKKNDALEGEIYVTDFEFSLNYQGITIKDKIQKYSETDEVFKIEFKKSFLKECYRFIIYQIIPHYCKNHIVDYDGVVDDVDRVIIIKDVMRYNGYNRGI